MPLGVNCTVYQVVREGWWGCIKVLTVPGRKGGLVGVYKGAYCTRL